MKSEKHAFHMCPLWTTFHIQIVTVDVMAHSYGDDDYTVGGS